MKKYLKVISQLLSMVIFVTVILGLSGTGVYDEQKLNAEAIALKLFEQDINPVDQSVLSYDLKSLDGENDYIIATGQDKGYVIFTRKDMQIVEYSAEGSSPFGNLNKSDSYYGGPANYFTKKDGEIENINTKERINKEHLKTISDNLREKTSAKRIDKVEEEKEVDVVKSNEVTAKSVAKPNLNVSLLSVDPGPTGTGSTDQGYVDIDEYQIVSQRYIPNYKYFTTGPKHGNNSGNECVVVATQLLLGYNNWANDGRLIPKSFLVGTENDRKVPYKKEGLGTIDAMFDLLKTYMFNTDNGVWLATATSAIGWYLTQFVDSSVAVLAITDYCLIGDGLVIRRNINAGYPVVVGMNNYSTVKKEDDQEEIEKDKHAVVVYGYQTFKVNGINIDGYIAHYGWGDSSANVWFNKDWAIDCMTFTTAHQHTTEKPITVSGNSSHITQCEECGRYKANNNHVIVDQEKRLIYEGSSIKYDSVFHDDVCCCGFKIKTLHNYDSYSTANSQMHYKQCSQCGYSKLEPHFSKYGDKCLYCGEFEIVY